MKKPLLFIYSIFVLLGLLSSCEGNEAESSSCPVIVGQWEWKKSIGAFGGPTITPDSLGITKTLIIDETTFTELINDTLQLMTSYKCVPITNSHFTLESVRLGTGESYVPMVYNDTLELGDIFMSGSKDIYWRK